MNSKVLLDSNSKSVRKFSGESFESKYFSLKSPIKETENEDGLGIFELENGRVVFVVTDGLGGHKAGQRASEISLLTFEELLSSHEKQRRQSQGLSQIIVECFEEANRRVIREIPGSGTTLVVGLLEENALKSFHAGDSELLVFNSELEVKFRTQNHSPVAALIQSGEITEEDALFHEERHLVVNVIGDPELEPEIGPSVKLDDGDYLLLASDGLFDNYSLGQLLSVWQGDDLESLGQSLKNCLLQKYKLFEDEDEESDEWAKADDMTFLLSRFSI